MSRIGIMALLLFASPILAATTPSEADYPVQYEVVNTNKVSSFMIGNFCTMTVRDQAKKNIAFILQKRGHGACHVWDSGTVFHGRRQKNGIEILVRDDKGKLKAEDWPIAGTVDIGI